MAAANNQIKLVGSVEINPANKTFDAKPIKDSKATAIVYLGGGKGLGLIIQGLQQTNQQIPIVGIDSVNDPKLASYLSNGQELYFTSPIYVDTKIQGPYLGLPLDRRFKPSGFEAVQATWLIMEALSSSKSDGLARKTVWENLSDVSIRGIGGEKLEWTDGQLSPGSIYVYRGVTKESDWFYKPTYIARLQ